MYKYKICVAKLLGTGVYMYDIFFLNCSLNCWLCDQFAPHYVFFTEARNISIIHFGLLLLESALGIT